MRQIIQDLRTGQTTLAPIPYPQAKPGAVTIATRRSLISAGTERMLLDFGRINWLGKARQQPEKVKEVLHKTRTDGILATVEAVQSKMDQPLPMGYSSVGKVVETGPGVEHLTAGDRVASNGPHAEIVRVPRNLCARVPDNVSDDAAAFTVVGAIALQGLRLAEPTLGETVVVTGVGLVGLLAVQLVRANGCRAIALDYDSARLGLASDFGAETVNLGTADAISAVDRLTGGRGADAVIITASTRSNEPVAQAAKMSRRRGRIVLVGVTGLELSRADFYEKELSFQVSCSYGPGRYDQQYEEGGQDYPFGFVRWTEQRNFQAILDQLSAGTLDVEPLISHRYPFDAAPDAYDLLTSGAPSLGILLEFGDSRASSRETVVSLNPPATQPSSPLAEPVVSFIGGGNYAARVLVPAFKEAGARLRSIATTGGLRGVSLGRAQGFEEATTDTDRLLADPVAHAVVIATRHDSHARLVMQALNAGKHVFVEKPLALTLEEIDEIEAAYHRSNEDGPAPLLMVGFNRRFAPHVTKLRELLRPVASPKAFIMTVNAGSIPRDHWTQDALVGGGRIVGEACHFVDLLRHLADAPIESWTLAGVEGSKGPIHDVTSFTLRFGDGSIGTVHYLANGHKRFPKERLEVFTEGRVAQLDNFRRLRTYGWPGRPGGRLLRQDKGNAACAAAFISAIRGGEPSPIPFHELLEVSRVSVELADSARGV